MSDAPLMQVQDLAIEFRSDRRTARALDGVSLEVRQVKEYRFSVVMRGEGLHPALTATDPQVTGTPPLRIEAEDAAARRTAALFNEFVDRAHELLADEPKANGITLRGFSTEPGLPNYLDSYGLRAACVASNLPDTLDGLWCWTDAALFAEAGIPAVCFGPGDIARAHSATEWVELDQLRAAERVLHAVLTAPL